MIAYHGIKKSMGFFRWLFWVYRGATKFGDREWAVRIFGVTLYNEVE